MKYALDMGHTPASPGASGHLDELTEDRKVGAALKRIMEAAGHSVIDVSAPDSMAYPAETNYRATKANGSGAGLFVSVHFNAGGGTGTEVLYYGGDSRGLELAARISAEVSEALGLPNRGAKARTNEVAVIRDTTMTAVLVEVCFVDTAADAKAYRAAGADKVAAAIARGLGIEAEEDMQLNDRITKGYIMDGTTYATVGNCLYWAESNAEKTLAIVRRMEATLAAQAEAIKALAKTQGADPDSIAKAVSDAVAAKLETIDLNITVG